MCRQAQLSEAQVEVTVRMENPDFAVAAIA